MMKIGRIKQIVCVAGLLGVIVAHTNNRTTEIRYEEREVLNRVVFKEPLQTEVEEIENNPFENRWGITEIDRETTDILAKVLYLEGHNTGLEGCQKVAVVIFNRFSDGRFFGGQEPSIRSVLSAKGQFSTYWRAANDPGFTATEQEYNAIQGVLAGEAAEDILNGTWLYFNGDGKQNYFW